MEINPIKAWFVLQTLTGQEQKVQKLITAQSKEQGLEEYIGDVLVPIRSEQVLKEKRKILVHKKLFPGYVFLNASVFYEDAKDGSLKHYEPVWTFIRGVQGVIGFLGGEEPQPMTEEEVDNILSLCSEAAKKPRPSIEFDIGEVVKIIEGPFMGFSGPVQEKDPDHGKLKVGVSIFGREVVAELDVAQVEREEVSSVSSADTSSSIM